tara:strand:- start:2012 stop:2353 length:342 start_codon:yes stop_codon:yes gene_type:complete
MFYDGCLRASFPLDDKDLNMDLFNSHANKMIVDALRDKQSLNFIKMTLLATLTTKKKKLSIVTDNDNFLENQFLGYTILALIKLKKIDPDGDNEGILITKKYPRDTAYRSRLR